MVSGARRGDRHRLVRWCALDSGGGAGMQEGFLQDCHRPSRLWMLQHPHGCGRRLTACGRISIQKTRRVAAGNAGSTAAPLALPRQTQRGPGSSHATAQQSVPHRSRHGGQRRGQQRGRDGAWGGVARLPAVRGGAAASRTAPRLSLRTSAWAEARRRRRPGPDHPAAGGRDRRRRGGRGCPHCPAPVHPPAGLPPG